MATGVIPTEGKEVLQDTLFQNYEPTLILRLFKSNTTPSNASVYADFTWADFTGYATVTLMNKFGWPFFAIRPLYTAIISSAVTSLTPDVGPSL